MSLFLEFTIRNQMKSLLQFLHFIFISRTEAINSTINITFSIIFSNVVYISVKVRLKMGVTWKLKLGYGF